MTLWIIPLIVHITLSFIFIYVPLMWVKQCHKPPMTGNASHTTYKNCDLGMVCYCFITSEEHIMRTLWILTY